MKISLRDKILSPWNMKISLRDKILSLWNMKISLRDKKISPWNIILFLGDKIISPWKYGNSELYHVVQERAEGPKAPSPGQRPGYNSISARRPVRAKALLIAWF